MCEEWVYGQRHNTVVDMFTYDIIIVEPRVPMQCNGFYINPFQMAKVVKIILMFVSVC